MTSSLLSQIDNSTSSTSTPPTQLALLLHAWSTTHTPQEILLHASGRSNLETSKSRPITPNSIFRLASCTKLITSLAALRLVQYGKLDLDDPAIIEQYLPELTKQEVFTSSLGQPFTYKKREKDITLRHLLSHSSGSGMDLIDPMLQAWRKERGERSLTLTGPVVEAHSVPLLFEPGEGWSYGGGYDWTGLLVERASGMRFGAFLRKEVFDVVGCDERIGFIGDLKEAGIGDEDIVQAVTRKGDGSKALKPWPTIPSREELGGGALLASSKNFGLVLADLIAEKPKVLERKWMDLIFEPQLEEGGKAVQALRKSSAGFSAMAGPFTDSIDPSGLNHGLAGLLVQADSKVLGKTTGTLVWGGAFSCVWFANRKQGVAGYFASSMFPPTDADTAKLTAQFIEEVWKKADKV